MAVLTYLDGSWVSVNRATTPKTELEKLGNFITQDMGLKPANGETPADAAIRLLKTGGKS